MYLLRLLGWPCPSVCGSSASRARWPGPGPAAAARSGPGSGERTDEGLPTSLGLVGRFAKRVSEERSGRFDWGPRQAEWKMITYPAPPLIPRLALSLGCLGILPVLSLHSVMWCAQPFGESIVTTTSAEADFCKAVVVWWVFGRKCGRAINGN